MSRRQSAIWRASTTFQDGLDATRDHGIGLGLSPAVVDLAVSTGVRSQASRDPKAAINWEEIKTAMTTRAQRRSTVMSALPGGAR